MKGKKLAMKNSNKVNKTGFNSSGSYRSASNPGRMNKSFDNRQFNLQDVTKLKQLCTATNEWIQQKSSELLEVLRRSENKSKSILLHFMNVNSDSSDNVYLLTIV